MKIHKNSFIRISAFYLSFFIFANASGTTNTEGQTPDVVENNSYAYSSGIESPSVQIPFYSAQTNPHISTTPCPFINTLIQRANQDQRILNDAPAVEELVDAADDYYGIDRGLMKKLANGVANSQGLVVLSDLLNPAKFPNHHGAFVRPDVGLNQISEPKRQEFIKRFGHLERISYIELEAFQTWCWHNTHMTLKDRLPAVGELALLTRLFEAYMQDNAFPRELIYNFLFENKLPENFIKSPNPLTEAGMVGIIIMNTCRILRG